MGSKNKRTKSFGIARLNWTGPDFWCSYADGYKRAAQLLIAAKKTIYETNTLIFPILSLYRQYIELSLKEVIAYGLRLEREGEMPEHHALNNLWADAKKYICRYCDNMESAEVDAMQRLVNQMHELDPTSQGTRYPAVKQKRKPRARHVKGSFDNGPDFINLDLLYEHINELAQSLEKVTSWLAILVSCCQSVCKIN
jgi:hypothetical protein